MVFRSTAVLRLAPFVLFLFVAACGGSGSDAPVALPDGWEGSGARFWRTGVDTAGVFPNLDSLEAMPVSGLQTEEVDRRGWVARNLKRELIVLYRTAPATVDSLFDAKVTPLIAQQNLNGPLRPVVDALLQPATQVLNRAIRQPRPTKTLGRDIEVPFPDSLRERIGGARVRTQVRLDAEGTPQAILILDAPNETLARITAGVVAQQAWSPVYVANRYGTAWNPAPGYVRYNVLFGNVGAE